ncbi:MAG: response regulator [Candidatus Omnitrophota bacterium]|nr:response regulator [Candidatus Omnitrophota bacterium]
MVENLNIKIALILEDAQLQDYIAQLLMGEDYAVTVFSEQLEAIKALENENFNMVISEFRSPKIDGLNICHALRRTFFYNLTPVLFVIPEDDALAVAKLTYSGADDFIKKSAVVDDLFLKVKLILYRASRYRDIHYATNLPGITYLLKEIDRRNNAGEVFAVSYLALAYFNEYNFRYGFKKGEELMQFTATTITKSLRLLGDAEDFLSHLYMDRFIFVTRAERTDEICERIVKDYQEGISALYDGPEAKNGYIELKDRHLHVEKYPFVAMYIGTLINEHMPMYTSGKILQVVNEIILDAVRSNKNYLKEEKKNYASF